MVKVSVVIPVYNAEKFLVRCLDSIIRQNFKDIEIILVNDGSNDNSLRICNEYSKKDKRIIVIDKINEGPSIARNKGVLNAKGEYIMFVDSDDWIESNMIANMHKKITEEKSDICISNYYRNYSDKEIECNLNFDEININKNEIKEKLIFQLIGRESFGSIDQILGFGAPWGKLFSINILMKYKILFNEELLIGEDLLFNIEALSKANTVTIDKNNYYHYWDNELSIMRRYKKNYWEIYRKLIKSIEKFIEKNNFTNDIGERFNIMKIEAVIRSIRNECSDKNEKNLFAKVKYINSICSDKIVKSTIENINYNEISFKRKLILELIKNKFSLILYICLKIV